MQPPDSGHFGSSSDQTVPAHTPGQWMPIESAPKDGTPVDLWRDGERLTNMCRVELAPDNVFYEPMESGPCVVRDASHWMPLPLPPDAQGVHPFNPPGAAVQTVPMPEPAVWFLNVNTPPQIPLYEQVSAEYAGDPDVVGLYTPTQLLEYARAGEAGEVLRELLLVHDAGWNKTLSDAEHQAWRVRKNAAWSRARTWVEGKK